jgi:metallo-beta-lactamase family protein
MIVLAASGMISGGRVLHHVEALAPDPRNTILLTGFQAAGTRGDSLARGARDLKMFGHWVPVHAEVARMDSLSAHSDADELLDWLGATSRPPRAVSVVHGEAVAADTLRLRLREELDWTATVPGHGETVQVLRAPGRSRHIEPAHHPRHAARA